MQWLRSGFPWRLKNYVETHLSQCAAPNIEFINNPELLYSVKDKKQECKLNDWLQPLTQDSLAQVYNKYLIAKQGFTKSQKLRLLENNLIEMAKHAPSELAELLKTSSASYWQRFLVNALAFNLEYKLDEKSIDFIELHKDVSLKSAATIIINHITHHAGDAKHAEFLVTLIVKQDFDAGIREIVLSKFINEAKEIKDYRVFTSFEKALSFDKQDNKLVLALAHASQNSAYTPSLESLIYFEKLLDSTSLDGEEQKFGAAAISKALQSTLENQDNTKYFGFVEQKLKLLLSKVGKLSHGLISAVFDVYKHDQTYFTNTILDIVATDKGLSKENLGKLLEPITKLKDVKAALFIGLRLVQNHINLSQDVLSYFRGFSENEDQSTRLMAAKLFDQIEFGTPNADARVKMDLEDLGWSSEVLSKLLINSDTANYPLFKAGVEKIIDYKVSTKDFDRNGQTTLDLLQNKKPAEWRSVISRLINDNHYFIAKDVDQLLTELKELNKDNKPFLKLVEDGWFIDQLNKVTDFQKNINTWQKEDLIKWRQGIQTVDDENIAEVLAALSQGIHNTVLENKHYPRPIQILSVLALFKSNTGGLVQIGTGEGKSIMVGMFAAIQVFLGHLVDIITSSPDLAKRDHDELKAFYDQFGITYGYNIVGGIGAKVCYKANIVYGDMLHFNSDALRDITENTKHGRGYGVVIVDEVDNMLIDLNNMRVQLSHPIPGFETLKQLLTYIFGESTQFNGRLEQRDSENCYTTPTVLNASLSEELGLANITKNVNNSISHRIGEDCNAFIKEVLSNFTNQALINPDQPKTNWVTIPPKHLVNFTREHVSDWLDSLIVSRNHYPDFDYIVSVPPAEIMNTNGTKEVIPVDHNNGAMLHGLMWPDGLHQLLELRHGATLKSESLTSVFMSYFGYLSKYKGSIYGVTGTLGSAEHHNFLNLVYGSDIIVMPTFVHKDLTRFDSIVLDNRAEWQEMITHLVHSKVGDDRAGLIIVDTVAEVHMMTKLLIDSDIAASKIFKYGVGGSNEAAIVKRGLKSGELLIATNAGGRGMNLKLTPEVLEHGGVHVIISTPLTSMRMDDQGEGRGARNGEPGSTQLVIHMDQVGYTDCTSEVDCLFNQRDEQEALKLKEDRLCRLPELALRDALYSKVIELVREINSPTGYILSLTKPEQKEIIKGTAYLYQENASIYLQVVKPDNSSIIQDITRSLAATELKVSKHIQSVLSKNGARISNLNQPDYEMVHFLIAKQPALSANPVIYNRVMHNFQKAVAQGVPVEWQKEEPAKYASGAESNYLTWLLFTDGNYTDLRATIEVNDTKIDQDIFKSAKDRKLYHLWLADRALFNYEFETRQMTEDWAFWFKKQSPLFKPYENCSIATEQERAETLKIQAEASKKLFEEFALFKAEEISKAKNGVLMKNPTYLVQQAWHLVDINFKQDGYTYSHQGDRSSSVWFNQSIRSQDSLASFDHYQIPTPLAEAVKTAEKATKLDEHGSWAAPNALGYIRILEQSPHLTKIEQKEAAARLRFQYEIDATETLKRLYNGVISPLETQATYLLNKGIVDYSDELFINLIGSIQVYQKIYKATENNIMTVRGSTAKQTVYVKEGVPLEQLTSDINITQAMVDLVNKSGTIDHITLQSISNATAGLEFPALGMVIKEVSYLGGAVCILGMRDLYEEKDWTVTIFSSALGVAQIFAGIALISMGGVFAVSLGTSLIAQGAGDIISAGIMAYKGIPLELGSYLNSKSMSMGIAIATAGTMHFLSSVKALEGIALIKNIETSALNAGKLLNANPLLFVGEIFAASALGTALGGLAYNAFKPVVDRDDIANKAAREADMLAREHEIALYKIMAADELNHNTKLMDALTTKIHEAAIHYLDLFNEDPTKFVRGYVTSMLGGVMGGVGSFMGFGVGAMADVGVTITLASYKNAGAMDNIVSETRKLIKEFSSSVGDLPADALTKKYDLSGFKSHVINSLTSTVVHIQKHELVERLANNIGNFVSSHIIKAMMPQPELVEEKQNPVKRKPAGERKQEYTDNDSEQHASLVTKKEIREKVRDSLQQESNKEAVTKLQKVFKSWQESKESTNSYTSSESDFQDFGKCGASEKRNVAGQLLQEFGEAITTLENNIINPLQEHFPKTTGVTKIIYDETMNFISIGGEIIGVSAKGWMNVVFGKETADSITHKGLDELQKLMVKISPEQHKALSYLSLLGGAATKAFGKFTKFEKFAKFDSASDTATLNHKYKTPKHFSDSSLKVNDVTLKTKLDKFMAEEHYLWEKFNTKELERSKFEIHHMVSEKSTMSKNHELWELSGLSPENGINKILLPKEQGGYASRSWHSGRHTNAHHDRLIAGMNEIRDNGLSQKWTTEQFRLKFQKILVEEREGLIKGNINLYMNKKGAK